MTLFERGLSPRVRGNRLRCTAQAATSGSIPARAGEPRGYRFVTVFNRVYPRACGGT